MFSRILLCFFFSFAHPIWHWFQCQNSKAGDNVITASKIAGSLSMNKDENEDEVRGRGDTDNSEMGI